MSDPSSIPVQIGAVLDGPVPDVVAPIRGFRKWEWDEMGLSSFNGVRWHPSDPMRAECKGQVWFSVTGNPTPRAEHACPWDPHKDPKVHSEHGCGIYAYSSFEDAWRNLFDSSTSSAVLGEVEVWGRVWPHERGYRAEFARPVVLYRRPDAPLFIWGDPIDLLAQMYGCEVRDLPLNLAERNTLAEEGQAARIKQMEDHAAKQMTSLYSYVPTRYMVPPVGLAARAGSMSSMYWSPGTLDQPDPEPEPARRRWYRNPLCWMSVACTALSVSVGALDVVAGEWPWVFLFGPLAGFNVRNFWKAVRHG